MGMSMLTVNGIRVEPRPVFVARGDALFNILGPVLLIRHTRVGHHFLGAFDHERRLRPRDPPRSSHSGHIATAAAHICVHLAALARIQPPSVQNASTCRKETRAAGRWKDHTPARRASIVATCVSVSIRSCSTCCSSSAMRWLCHSRFRRSFSNRNLRAHTHLCQGAASHMELLLKRSRWLVSMLRWPYASLAAGTRRGSRSATDIRMSSPYSAKRPSFSEQHSRAVEVQGRVRHDRCAHRAR